MKHNLSLLVGAALLGLASGAVAATAVTDPVGYITLPVTGGGTPTAPKESLIGTPLVNKAEFTGAVSTAAASVINFAGTPFAADQFNGANGLFYAEVTSGAGAGAWSDIVATAASSVTTADSLAANIAAGSTVVIRKHHTVSSLFGATNQAGGFGGGVDVSGADELLILDSSTQTPTIFFFSTDDLNPGWVTAGGLPASNVVIAPGSGILVKRKTAGDLKIVQVGHVKTGPTWIKIDPSLNVLAQPLATGTTLTASGLVASGIGSGVDSSTADLLQTLTNGALEIYFNSTDDLNPGWVTAGGTPSPNAPLAEGTGFILNRKGAAFEWKAPAQVISTTP